jgi:hypothetical protein
MTVELMLNTFIAWVGFLVFVLIVVYAISPSKSKIYRQDLSNMYVVGKIKQIAKKEGLDLNAEFAEFAKVTKNKKIDFEALDMTVERELQEKLTEKTKTKDQSVI